MSPNTSDAATANNATEDEKFLPKGGENGAEKSPNEAKDKSCEVDIKEGGKDGGSDDRSLGKTNVFTIKKNIQVFL